MNPIPGGDLVIQGRVLPASNHTFLADVGGVAVVYKPVSGERPLWDFSDGTLAQREYAAYLVSEALGWGIVPPTELREGPAGPGMVQLWCEPDDPGAVDRPDPVDLVPVDQVPAGWHHVLDAHDGQDRPVALIHEDSPALRRMAVFDVLTNNTDRKGGHILPFADGRRLGVDHGICFHVEDKLRTVLWGWAGEPLDAVERDAVTGFVESDLDALLGRLLTPREVERTRERGRRLLTRGLPTRGPGWPSIPWPPF